MEPTTVLATLTGRDRPGLTASVFAALAAHDVDVRDVEQVVVRNRLMLSVLFDLRGDVGALRGSIGKAASALGMDSEVVVADAGHSPAAPVGASSHVMVLAGRLRPGALGQVAQHLADHGANIESIGRPADTATSCLELTVRCPDPAKVRSALIGVARDVALDIAVQPSGLRQRAKRLVLLDIPTALQYEAGSPVSALAERAGVAAEMQALSARAASGDLDSDSALRGQASLLAGLPEAAAHDVQDRVRLHKSAGAATAALRRLGYAVGAVTCDFGLAAESVAADVGLDVVAANRLEVDNGALTGRLVEPVIDVRGKALVLADFADDRSVPMSQTVAVDAGGPDSALLESAALGIACGAASGSATSALDTVLFVLGAA